MKIMLRVAAAKRAFHSLRIHFAFAMNRRCAIKSEFQEKIMDFFIRLLHQINP
jgi:hypothetical protein